jgi:TRAP-type C4-dicarboxylate transport system substrate-binding protein
MTRLLPGAVLGAVLCAAPALAADPVKLRVADSFPSGHYIGEKITKFWMAEATKRSNGAVTFEYYPAEQLGKAKDMLTLTTTGVVDVGYVAPSFVTDKLPLSGVAELPLNFSESCQGTAAYARLVAEGGVLAKKELGPAGVRVLFQLVLPPYQAFLGKKVIENLGTLQGLKVRTSGSAKELAVRKLGATPIQMPTPEVYEALSRGTIDGMLFPFSSIYSYDLQGLLKSATVGENLGSFIVAYMISERKWKSLSPEAQKALAEAGEATTKLGCQIAQETESKDTERLRALGVTLVQLNAADKAKVREGMASVGADWAAALDKRGKPGTEVLKAFEEALK